MLDLETCFALKEPHAIADLHTQGGLPCRTLWHNVPWQNGCGSDFCRLLRMLHTDDHGILPRQCNFPRHVLPALLVCGIGQAMLCSLFDMLKPVCLTLHAACAHHTQSFLSWDCSTQSTWGANHLSKTGMLCYSMLSSDMPC